jgi:hypothetical protein
MADGFVFDWDTEYPHPIFEAMRQRVNAAIADLEQHATQLDGALLLCLTAFDFAQTVLSTLAPLQQQVTTQAAEIADLQAQVAALQPTTTEAQ